MEIQNDHSDDNKNKMKYDQNSSKVFLEDYFKNDILWGQLEDFPKTTNHLENFQQIVGCFINVGYTQTPNIQMRIESLKKLRIYLKHDPHLFFTMFITIKNSFKKNLKSSEKSYSEFRKTAYQIFLDLILNYEKLWEIDNLKLFTFMFKTLTDLIIQEKKDEQDEIPKIFMNFISNNLFFTEIYSNIMKIACETICLKSLEIYLKVLESLFANTPKRSIFELIDWKELFEIFFTRSLKGNLKQESLFIDLFNFMRNLLHNDFTQINLDKNTLEEINSYIELNDLMV